jgi:hypothetical protein
MKIFFMYFYYLFEKCIYIYILKYVFINSLFIIALIIKINMDECDILNELSLSRLVMYSYFILYIIL